MPMIVNLLSKLLNAVLVFSITIYALKFFGSEELGRLAAFQSLVLFTQPFMSIGLSGYYVRFCPVGDRDKAQEFTISMLISFLIISTFASLSLLLMVEFLPVFSDGEIGYGIFSPYFIVASISLSLVMLLQTICSVTRKYYSLAFLNVLLKLAFILFILLVGISEKYKLVLNKNLFFWEYASSLFVLCCLIFYIIFLVIKLGVKVKTPMIFTLDFWREIKDFFAISLIHVLNSVFGILIAYYLLSAEDVGQLALAQRFTLPFVFILSVVNNFTASDFKLSFSKFGAVGLIRSSRDYSRANFFKIFGVFLLLSVSIFPSIKILGLSVDDFWGCIIILLIGYLINVTYLASGNVLIILGFQKVERDILAYSILINVLVIFMCINYIGVIAVALGQAVAMITVNIMTDYHLKRKFGASIFPF